MTIIGVDLFAGCGGLTTAAESVGVSIAFAANHWKLAVEVHALNHPHVRHEQQDLRQFDFATLAPFDLLLAGVACQPHSKAGQVGRKHSAKTRTEHKHLRSTAWAVIDCAEVCRPKSIIVENVPEFQRWALLPEWRGALERLGYHVTMQVLTASRWGVPQRRRRLFVIADLRRAIEVEDLDVDEPGIRTVFDEGAGPWLSIDDIRARAAARSALRLRATVHA